MADKNYFLTYKLERHIDGLTREEVPADMGACDAGVFLSMIYPEDGSFSMAVVSMDGRTGEPVSDNELFKVWTLIAHRLAESSELPDGPGTKRDLARKLFQIVSDTINKARSEAVAGWFFVTETTKE